MDEVSANINTISLTLTHNDDTGSLIEPLTLTGALDILKIGTLGSSLDKDLMKLSAEQLSVTCLDLYGTLRTWFEKAKKNMAVYPPFCAVNVNDKQEYLGLVKLDSIKFDPVQYQVSFQMDDWSRQLATHWPDLQRVKPYEFYGNYRTAISRPGIVGALWINNRKESVVQVPLTPEDMLDPETVFMEGDTVTMHHDKDDLEMQVTKVLLALESKPDPIVVIWLKGLVHDRDSHGVTINRKSARLIKKNDWVTTGEVTYDEKSPVFTLALNKIDSLYPDDKVEVFPPGGDKQEYTIQTVDAPNKTITFDKKITKTIPKNSVVMLSSESASTLRFVEAYDLIQRACLPYTCLVTSKTAMSLPDAGFSFFNVKPDPTISLASCISVDDVWINEDGSITLHDDYDSYYRGNPTDGFKLITKPDVVRYLGWSNQLDTAPSRLLASAWGDPQDVERYITPYYWTLDNHEWAKWHEIPNYYENVTLSWAFDSKGLNVNNPFDATTEWGFIPAHTTSLAILTNLRSSSTLKTCSPVLAVHYDHDDKYPLTPGSPHGTVPKLSIANSTITSSITLTQFSGKLVHVVGTRLGIFLVSEDQITEVTVDNAGNITIGRVIKSLQTEPDTSYYLQPHTLSTSGSNMLFCFATKVKRNSPDKTKTDGVEYTTQLYQFNIDDNSFMSETIDDAACKVISQVRLADGSGTFGFIDGRPFSLSSKVYPIIDSINVGERPALDIMQDVGTMLGIYLISRPGGFVEIKSRSLSPEGAIDIDPYVEKNIVTMMDESYFGIVAVQGKNDSITGYSERYVKAGEILEMRNDLIASSSQARAIAEYYVDFFSKPRTELEQTWTLVYGKPNVEAGSIVSYQQRHWIVKKLAWNPIDCTCQVTLLELV